MLPHRSVRNVYVRTACETNADFVHVHLAEVAEAVGQEWSQYQREADTITRQTVDEPAGLKSAISLLPE
jgi:hypothetical protein